MDDNVMCYKIPPNSYCKCPGLSQTEPNFRQTPSCHFPSSLFFFFLGFCENHSLHYLILPCILIQWPHLIYVFALVFILNRARSLKWLSVFMLVARIFFFSFHLLLFHKHSLAHLFRMFVYIHAS